MKLKPYQKGGTHGPGKICLKLNELQEVLVNDEDFLKRVIESFCQKFKDVEITQFLQADKHQRQDEKVRLPKWL